MKKFYRLLCITMIAATLLFTGLLFSSKYALSQGKVMPGTLPIKSREDAIAIGRTIVSSLMAKGTTANQITLKEAKQLDPSGLKSGLARDGAEANQIVAQQKDEVWVVIFSGLFTPKHLHFPVGVKPEIPVYSTIEIYLSAKDGGAVGLRVYDQISPPQ